MMGKNSSQRKKSASDAHTPEDSGKEADLRTNHQIAPDRQEEAEAPKEMIKTASNPLNIADLFAGHCIKPLVLGESIDSLSLDQTAVDIDLQESSRRQSPSRPWLIIASDNSTREVVGFSLRLGE